MLPALSVILSSKLPINWSSLLSFCENNKSKAKKFCFDLDNTLVTYPKIVGDYNTVNPITKNIKFLNFLKSSGNYIIIYTARRMRTYKGNIKKVKKEIEQLTINQLKKFNINYDELIFGKPYANFYIDDLSVSPTENLNIKLGYYEKKDNLTRDFNDIVIGEKFTPQVGDVKDRIQNNLLKIKTWICWLKKVYLIF